MTENKGDKVTHYIRYELLTNDWQVCEFKYCGSSWFDSNPTPTRAEAQAAIFEWNRTVPQYTGVKYELWEPERTYTPVLPGIEKELDNG